MSTDKSVGERLRKAREKKGLSLYAVEKISGLHFSTIAGYERNERSPSLQRLKQLCDLYGITPDYALGYGVSSIESFSPEIQELLKQSNSIPYLELADWLKRRNIDPHTLKEAIELVSRIVSSCSKC